MKLSQSSAEIELLTPNWVSQLRGKKDNTLFVRVQSLSLIPSPLMI
jgi:hypothetical protein